MEKNIKMLLKKIDFLDSIELFETAKLIKIVSNKDKTKYNFYIDIDEVLPIAVYKDLKDKLNLTFKVSVNIHIKSVKNKYVSEYYRYFIDKYSKDYTSLAMLKDSKFDIEEDKLIIEVGNKAEKLKLETIVDDLKKDFKKVGLKYTIEIIINSDVSIKLKEEIKKELTKKYEVKEAVVMESEPQKFTNFNYERKPLIGDTSDKKVVIGSKIDGKPVRLDTAFNPGDTIIFEGVIFGLDIRESKKGLKIIKLKITDYTDSIYAVFFVHNDDEFKSIKGKLHEGSWYKMKAKVKDKDQYNQDISLIVSDIYQIEKETKDKIIDDAPVKRVELHAHTMMSKMDGLIKVDISKHRMDLLSKTIEIGHKAVAITDHNGCQSFPTAFSNLKGYNKGKDEKDKFKVLYGAELVLVDDTVNIVKRETDAPLLESTYVVFDLETTGFNAGGADSIIEIGAVKICNGEVIDRYDRLINPGRKLPDKIVELTHITDDMLKDKGNEEDAVIEFKEWIKDLPMVAHNAKFDTSFISMAYQKYNLGDYLNPIIDTLELSRTLDNNYARHSLSVVTKRYGIKFNEEGHHRADFDAEGTALVFHEMLKKLIARNFKVISDLDNLVSKDEIYKYGRTYHFNMLAQTQVGLKNLFKIISLANTDYLYKTPRILRSKIEELREGILIGSGCYLSEVFVEARSKSDEELANIINFYDYVEVQPLDCYDHLLQMGDFGSMEELKDNVKKIIRVTKEAGKIMVATGDVHHFDKEDKIYRKIIVNQKVPGGGRHPLARKNIKEIPSMHFRTTREMLENFNFLDEDLAYEIVVENTNKIADSIDELIIIEDTKGIPFSPKIDNSVNIVKDMVYKKAREWYGKDLPKLIEDRIIEELKGIIGGGFDVIYLISQKLVKKSNDDGFLVGSRGSVGSSFVATMMGITEVNPLAAHYRCPDCKLSIFEDEKGTLGSRYSSGFDLPDMICPKCGAKMIKDGQDMPFATFLGFNCDKVPDIDLNFSDLNQGATHDYTKVLFGIDNVYRAGTIGTVASKTAYGFTKGYCEENNLVMRSAEIERLSIGCTGVKRTTGQHPGGIVVIPKYKDIFDFTPYQFPANDVNAAWRTTHFDYHAIDESVLKLDILGHSDPTQLRMIQDLSGIDVTTVPFDDRDTLDIFLSPKPLGVTKEQILCDTGTICIPEFGTPFTISMLKDTKPKSFAELIKISGLSHGTDVWVGNAQDLIKSNIVPFSEVIGCRDDIMVYLMYHGLEPIDAFNIMEFVRKGKASKQPDKWAEYVKIMEKCNIKKWFINSCWKIKYMFPKAHAAAYVMSAFRIAYFKVHYPKYYYASYFSTRLNDFDIEAMNKGYDAIKNRIIEIQNKGYEATNKENSTLDSLRLSLEATARNFEFAKINILKSDSNNFIIENDNILIPPFRTVEGLGDAVANNIIRERKKREFLSVEDFAIRSKASSTIVEKLRMMGVFDGMDESSQLSLF